MSKRQRTFSISGGEEPTDKRHKPSDDDRPDDVQTRSSKMSPSSSRADGEAQKHVDGAIVGRQLRKRPLKEVQARISGDEEDTTTSEDDDGSVYGEVAKKKPRSQPITRQQLKLIKQVLSIRRKDMKLSFNDLKISYCLANPPYTRPDGSIGERDETDDSDGDGDDAITKDNTIPLVNTFSPAGKQSSNGERLCASRVKMKDLEPFGWRFEDLSRRGVQPAPQGFNAEHIYIPISLEKSPVAWTVPPFKMITVDSIDKGNGGKASNDEDENQNVIKVAGSGAMQEVKPHKPTDNIRKAWYWALKQLTVRSLPHEIPLEWADLPEPFYVRPEMPEDFKGLLEPEQDASAGKDVSPCSSLDQTPVKTAGTFSGQSKLREFWNKGLDLDVIHEQSETTGILGGENLEQRSLPRQPSSGPFSNGSTSTERPQNLFLRVPDERPQYQAAETLIKQHKLMLTSKDARRLEELLVQSRRQYDLEHNKRLLCQELGPVDGNRKSDPGAGTLGFVYVPMKEIEDRDRQHHTGNTARTANATQIHNTAMEMNFRWARLTRVDAEIQSETLIDRQVGNLFTGLFAFDGFQETANTTMRFPNDLLLFSTEPHPDYGVRAGGDRWSHWPITLLPMVASGDNKLPKNASRDAEAQLACNMRPTLILEILMYLDTRPKADAPLPAWMWNYSWICTSTGFVIYIHYPSPKLSENGKDWRWTMVSLLLTKAYSKVWASNDRTHRLRAKAAVDLMVSHTSFVHNQIQAWSVSRGQFGEGGIMNQLLARAEYEEENFKQLHEWAKLVDGAYEEKSRSLLGVGT